MIGAFRTQKGGYVNRARAISFTFDGNRFVGLAGDTLASALLANGVHLVGRSFKYHRPRGIVAAGAEEPNALVCVNRGGGRATPNLRATQIEIYEGLSAISQNRWPSLSFDIGAINDAAPGIFSAGFYYKTFMAPASAWHKLYEPVIRRAAGLGEAAREPDPDRYAQAYAHCDVLVVGSGPAGLAAALAASRNGSSVILCDEQAALGNSLRQERDVKVAEHSAAALQAGDWAQAAVSELAAAGVTLLPRTQAFGYYAQNFVALAQNLTDHLPSPSAAALRERLWKVRAKQVVLATGAIERPLVFPDNDRPGIMLASAARTYLNLYGVKAGSKAVVFTADDSGHAAALDLAKAGVTIAAIADCRTGASTAGIAASLAAGLPVLPASVIVGVSGAMRVTGASIGSVRDGRVTPTLEAACDLILMAGGWTPAVHLFSQSRGKLRFDPAREIFVPGEAAQAQFSAGACNGASGIAASLAQGFAAGLAAAGAADADSGFTVTGELIPAGGWHGAVAHHRDPARVKAFVDFQNDVTAKDIKLAVQEGFHSIEHVKRYTTTGMATDQGKTSNMNALAIAAKALGKSIPEVGLTTFRAPYTPVTFGLFAGHSRGDLFDPVRTTPIHPWAGAQGAVFEDVGQWKRARYFPQTGENMQRAVNRECRAVRDSGGVFDASTLGKIEVVGPDAAEFMNRLYTNAWTKLEPGRCRYGLMLNEAGFIMDDGVVARMAHDRFHVTTTTGGAARVMHHMEDYLQTEFTGLKVWLTSTTEQWAVIAVQGPNARKLLEPLVDGIDLSPAAFAHMSVREGRICGVPTRLFRMSFTGELGFEINVPSGFGREVWEKVWTQAQKHGMTVYGTEAMHVLRAEKGFIIVGQETDGTVTPEDAGMGAMVGKSKPDFVGKRSLGMSDLLKSDRKQLVGLLTANPATVLEEGAQITAEANPPKGTGALGHVTSAYWSQNLGRSIALALVAGGRARLGQKLNVPMPSGAVEVELVAPVFVDAKGERLHG